MAKLTSHIRLNGSDLLAESCFLCCNHNSTSECTKTLQCSTEVWTLVLVMWVVVSVFSSWISSFGTSQICLLGVSHLCMRIRPFLEHKSAFSQNPVIYTFPQKPKKLEERKFHQTCSLGSVYNSQQRESNKDLTNANLQWNYRKENKI